MRPSRATLDSNVLIYAALEPMSEKGKRAQSIIQRAAPFGILTVQALLEFVAVVRKKSPGLLSSAIAQAAAWSAVFETAPTTAQTMEAAMNLAAKHQMQIWDAVILASAAAAGATLFLSEDMGDGELHLGVTIQNPFKLGDDALAQFFSES